MSTDEPASASNGGGGLVRLRLDLGYDGTTFSGWAAQPGRRTVEATLAQALATVLRADPVRLIVAGRTDAGVHARGQVAHVDVERAVWQRFSDRSARAPQTSLLARLLGVLPVDVVAHRVSVAPQGFDARFSATSRRYSYRICDAPAELDPTRRGDTVVLPHRLDLDSLNQASANLLGLRDFAAFCKRREGATTIRTLLAYEWVRQPDGVIVARVQADAFCHSMVRSLVGAVVPVGAGRHRLDWSAHVLTARSRHPLVTVMPPHGLCLEHVTYPADDQLAERAAQARSRRTPI